MNCQEFEIVVRDLARAQASDRITNELQLPLDHAASCSACELKLEDERELSRKLAAVASVESEPSSHIEAALLQAYRQTTRKVAVATSVPVFRRPVYWFAAAAAALLLVFALGILRSRLSTPKPGLPIAAVAHNEDATTSAAAVVNPPATSIRVEPVNDAPPRKAHRINPRRLKHLPARVGQQVVASAPIEPQPEPEIATQFIALSAVGPLNLQDGGQIVRVELSRLAMASFGLPVNMDRSGERVKADVLLSADGFARAIRFIQ
jgi:hypothetical protein